MSDPTGKKRARQPRFAKLEGAYGAQNDCYFCQHAHGAVAAYRLNGDEQLVDSVKATFEVAAISETNLH